jgi:hypothetical protein
MAGSPLSLPVGIVLAVLALAEVSFRAYVPARYIPERTLRAALEAGDRCVVTLGDSRMVAGVNAAVVKSGLEQRGRPSCLAELAIGGGSIHVQYLAFRRYLEAAPAPRLLVLGVSVDSLLAPERPADPESMIGNEALALGWSQVEDVWLLYPGFPARHFDPGMRFLFHRSTYLTSYGSLLWAKTRALQDRLVGSGRSPQNRFGLVSDMETLADELRDKAARRLSDFPSRASLHPAFRELLRRAHAHRVKVLVVEVPMPPAHRASLHESGKLELVRAAIREMVRASGGTYDDLGSSPWAEDRFFSDSLHLDGNGALRFSADLAARVLASMD